MPKDISQHSPPAQQNFALGTVGWDSDQDNYDLGTAGQDKVLVKVTLVWGRNPTEDLNGATAQGAKITATLPGPIFHLPNLGDLVELGIPQGMEMKPGAATIRGWHKIAPEGFDANNAMWPIEDGKFVIIGDKNAVAAALGTVCKAWFDEIKSKFDNHTHGYLSGTAGAAVSTPPSANPLGTPPTTITNEGDPRAQKMKIT